ncbi:MAG: IS110 family transposase [Pseudomonadota bacterium]
MKRSAERLEIVGIDLAKSVFQIHGVDASGKALVRKKLSRGELIAFMENLPKTRVVMEACGGSNYWARRFREMGHEVKLIAPQFVKPFVKTNKSDKADAEAIVEAGMRPGMRFVGVKEEWQQDILSVHRVRARLMKSRTALINELRGLLQEYGIVFSRRAALLPERVADFLSKDAEGISGVMVQLVQELLTELMEMESRIDIYDRKIMQVSKDREECKVVKMVSGVGPITATALVATIGDINQFRNGRQLSAYLGLVPRHEGSGGKIRIKGISKRGDRYVRMLLIHGARVVLRHAQGRSEGYNRWVKRLAERRGYNKACVALANKNARMCFAMLKKYREGKTVLAKPPADRNLIQEAA